MEADELQYGLEEEEEDFDSEEDDFVEGGDDDDDGVEDVPQDDETYPDKIYFGGERQVNDMAFHPSQDLLGAAIIDGCIELFRYVPQQAPTKMLQIMPHKESCRSIRFSHDGNYVFSGGADRALVALDLNAQKIVFSKENAHKDGLTCMAVHENLVTTGDDEGGVKLWDLRQTKQLFAWKQNEDFISELAIVDDKKTILAPSGDGTLSVFNMRKARPEAQSENMEDELLSVVVLKHGNKVVCGSQGGILDIYSWGQWGDISDRFPGHPQSIDAIIAIDEDTIVTGSSDGLIRVVGIHPNKMMGIVGEHGDMPIECMALSHDNRFLTTASHDYSIKFWNVGYLFEGDGDEDEEEEEEEGEEGEAEGEAADEENGDMQTEEAEEMEAEAKPSGKNRRKKNSKRSFFSGLK